MSENGRATGSDRLVKVERTLLSHLSAAPESMPLSAQWWLRYALCLGKLSHLSTPGGAEIEAGHVLSEFAGWLADQTAAPALLKKGPDFNRLTALVPHIMAHVDRARSAVLAHSAGQLDPVVLDAELCQKSLVLVLGGGGGSGFAHLGLFSLLKDLEITPGLVSGSSMGALLGLFRCLRKEWDPTTTFIAVPKRFDRRYIFRPFDGQIKYGFPGAFKLQLDEMAGHTLDLVCGKPCVTFADLEIPLQVVVTGIRGGMRAALEQDILGKSPYTTLTGLSLRGRLGRLVKLFRTILENPGLTEELVFSRQMDGGEIDVVDAVGFSCAVPGLFCYDLVNRDPSPTQKALDELFKTLDLWGVADGGVINNLPARVALDGVDSGLINTRNVYVYALDPFQPRLSSPLFLPMQQLAQFSTTANLPYVDHYRAYQSPPSPIEFVLTWNRAREVADEIRNELEKDSELLRLVFQRLPSYPELMTIGEGET